MKIFSVLLILLFHTTRIFAFNATYALSPSLQQSVLDEHNRLRALHVDTPPLVWDDALASFAQDWAAKYDCSGILTHSQEPYGENLAIGYTAIEATDAWYDEIRFYNYSDPQYSETTGHFTQMVWKDSNKLGCALRNCYNAWTFYFVCEYDPPGNYIGDFSFEVMPLISSLSSSTSSSSITSTSIATSSTSYADVSQIVSNSLVTILEPSPYSSKLVSTGAIYASKSPADGGVSKPPELAAEFQYSSLQSGTGSTSVSQTSISSNNPTSTPGFDSTDTKLFSNSFAGSTLSSETVLSQTLGATATLKIEKSTITSLVATSLQTDVTIFSSSSTSSITHITTTLEPLSTSPMLLVENEVTSWSAQTPTYANQYSHSLADISRLQPSESVVQFINSQNISNNSTIGFSSSTSGLDWYNKTESMGVSITSFKMLSTGGVMLNNTYNNTTNSTQNSLFPSIRGSNITSSDITTSNILASNITYSNITYSNITHSNITHSNITHSNITYSNITHSNITYSNITHSNITYSNITHSNITRSNITYSNITFSNITTSNITHSNTTALLSSNFSSTASKASEASVMTGVSINVTTSGTIQTRELNGHSTTSITSRTKSVSSTTKNVNSIANNHNTIENNSKTAKAISKTTTSSKSQATKPSSSTTTIVVKSSTTAGKILTKNVSKTYSNDPKITEGYTGFLSQTIATISTSTDGSNHLSFESKGFLCAIIVPILLF
ncbi:similar to Saccharomyces cerevisiae YJL078C PRY3 Cell wall protein with a role in mating efficiency [Maudiozyma saulgeensis]|uniref:Similar to Saccharomyces cerevisiae YJL078C PRY3 Cell wall protein with a role in mating efficiency n=1 Tax=Maudiozyma saulgeensis TaxID=1789683 RepID=A0A1X7R7T5_9SACH|nr:similar to Saccharomyces cerevisiae YJL078C PRY3 Cell wall protein with a role in mating efficiency [Kazachstania saulgeensis]